MSEPSAAGALVPGAKCRAHPQRSATGVCARCGDYLCGACGRRVGARLHCVSCATRTLGEHSKRAAYALVIGLCSVLPPLYFLSPVALVLSVLELTAIRDGAAPLGGRAAARAGLLSAVAGLAMPVSLALAYLATR
jgi:hypothetical protein